MCREHNTIQTGTLWRRVMALLLPGLPEKKDSSQLSAAHSNLTEEERWQALKLFFLSETFFCPVHQMVMKSKKKKKKKAQKNSEKLQITLTEVSAPLKCDNQKLRPTNGLGKKKKISTAELLCWQPVILSVCERVCAWPQILPGWLWTLIEI